MPENNKDIYAYNIKTKQEIPIATGPFMESKPDIFNYYVVWEDRNNGTINADILLYNLYTKKTMQITSDKFNQGDPKIYYDTVVWMDERRGGSANDVVLNGRQPNSDIFMYNIKSKILSKDLPAMVHKSFPIYHRIGYRSYSLGK